MPLEKAQAFADACKDLFEKGKATRREMAALVGKLMWWNPAIFNVKLLSKALQQQTGGIDGAQLWDEVVQFLHLALRELQFWAHNTVEMATHRKPMILPRFKDLEIEWARLESGGVQTAVVLPIHWEAASSQTESPMAGAPRCGYQGYKNPSVVTENGDSQTSRQKKPSSRHGAKAGR